jgi:hypothetical protein
MDQWLGHRQTFSSSRNKMAASVSLLHQQNNPNFSRQNGLQCLVASSAEQCQLLSTKWPPVPLCFISRTIPTSLNKMAASVSLLHQQNNPNFSQQNCCQCLAASSAEQSHLLSTKWPPVPRSFISGTIPPSLNKMAASASLLHQQNNPNFSQQNDRQCLVASSAVSVS